MEWYITGFKEFYLSDHFACRPAMGGGGCEELVPQLNNSKHNGGKTDGEQRHLDERVADRVGRAEKIKK
jgi:hypothetical protein